MRGLPFSLKGQAPMQKLFRTRKALCARNSRRGSALVYILIAIALLAALTVTFLDNSSTQQARSQNSFRLTADIDGQLNMIKSAIQDCILQYPEGERDYTPPAAHSPFPLDADDTHQISPAPNGNKLASAIRCPGNPGDSANYQPLFGGASNRFLSATPEVLDDWVYRNGTNMSVDGDTVNGVYFLIKSNKTDPYIAEAFQKLDQKYTQCEVDYIDSTSSSAAGCPSGYKCLRVWMKRVSSSTACP